LNWHVELDRRAERELTSLPNPILKRITDRLAALSTDPFPRGVKKLHGGSGYRLRVGDYRVLYDVFPKEHEVVVYAVGHRRDVYRK
jgi:mRNA interferase RelE/StbE